MDTENIDLLEILKKLWRRKLAVLVWTGGCLAVGLVIYSLQPRIYRAECIVQWERSENSRQISPSLYQEIFFSDGFMRRLIHRPFTLEEQGDTVTYFSMLTGRRDLKAAAEENRMDPLSADEGICIERLKKASHLTVNHDGRYFTLAVESENPARAALVAEQAQQAFRKAICEEGEKKVRSELAAIENRYLRLKEDLRHRREQLVEALEKAQSYSAARREVEKKILMEDYDLFYAIYADSRCEYEKARIALQEDRSDLTVIRPVVEPSDPWGPRPRKQVLASLLIGILLGCAWALLMPERRR